MKCLKLHISQFIDVHWSMVFPNYVTIVHHQGDHRITREDVLDGFKGGIVSLVDTCVHN